METREMNEDGKNVLYISGEIDGTNVDEFEAQLNAFAEKSDEIQLNLSELEYVSSTGLRVFLTVQKKVKQRGCLMELTNVNEEVMDIFTVTGFVKLLNIV